MGGQRLLEPVIFVTLHLQDGNWSHTHAVSHKCDPPRPRQFSRSQRLAENEDDSLIVEPSLRITFVGYLLMQHRLITLTENQLCNFYSF
jgi:hypothetical protein